MEFTFSPPTFRESLPYFDTFALYLGSPERVDLLFTIALITGVLFYCCTHTMKSSLPVEGRLTMNKQALPYPYDQDCIASRSHGLGMDGNFFTYLYSSCKTIPDIIMIRGKSEVTGGGAKPALGIINGTAIQWMTYSDLWNEIHQIASGLRVCNLIPKIERNIKPKCIGVCAARGQEHTIVEHSIMLMGGIYVPVHNHFGNQTMIEIIYRTKMSTIFIDDVEKGKYIIDKAPKNLIHIIASNTIGPVLKTKAHLKGMSYHTLSALKSKAGRKLIDVDEQLALIQPHRHAVCFFSINNDDASRGILLTHENLLSAASAVAVHLDKYFLSPDDVYYAHLGRHHTYEMVWNFCALMQGSKIIYGTGAIFDDLRIARPTFLVTPPWIVNKIFEDYIEVYNNAFFCRRLPIKCGFAKKKQNLETGSFLRGTFTDMMLGFQVQRAFGGKLRMLMISGGSLYRDVSIFMKSCLNCFVLHSYGTAESSGFACMTVPGDNMVDHVGAPLPCNLIKLINTEKYQNIAVTPEELLRKGSYVGEIAIRGSNVGKEYMVRGKDDGGLYVKEDMVRLITDGQGFARTNDLGRILRNGTVQLVGRLSPNKKNASGEWIAPVRIEKILHKECKLIKKLHIYVNRYRYYSIAFVNPKSEPADENAILNDIFQTAISISRTTGIKSYQVPQTVVILSTSIPKGDYLEINETIINENIDELERAQQASLIDNEAYGGTLQDLY